MGHLANHTSIQNDLGPAPRTCRCFRVSLMVRYAGTTGSGGTTHETARVHHAARRRGGGMAACGARAAGASAKLGFLGASTSAVGGPWLSVLVQRLGELGWTEGRNLQIDARWAEGRNDRAAEIATEFARAHVDLIVTWATGPALAAKQATVTIPIVFALATDPVGSGLAASLARPASNATGLSAFNLDLVGKRVELLREIVPDLRRLSVLGNVGVADTAFELRGVIKTAQTLGLIRPLSKSNRLPTLHPRWTLSNPTAGVVRSRRPADIHKSGSNQWLGTQPTASDDVCHS